MSEGYCKPYVVFVSFLLLIPIAACNEGEAGAVGKATTNDGNILSPFLSEGDPIDITVYAEPSVFDPVTFSGVPYSRQALSRMNLSVTRTLDLSDCLVGPCTADVIVKWKAKGVVHETRQSLIRHLHRQGDSKTHKGSLAPFVQSRLTVSPIIEFTTPLPPQYARLVHITDDFQYIPAVVIDRFWLLRQHMIEINESSVAGIPNITIDIWPTTHWKVLWFRKLDISFRQQQQSGLLSAEDADEIKRIFLETNVYLLAVTGIVTVLHMVFEYLAFSNTIKFWKGKSDFSGLSLKTLGINCYFESITFLYLLESNEASWMILFPAFVGCLVQYWTFAKTVKVSRAASVDSSEAGGFSLCGLKISFPAAYDSKTREYDDKAVKYLTLAMIPFLIGYSIYSALYGEHKGVYSYLIYTQAQFVYFFGFAMMTPQLFINYKLKTVSQLPWRSFVFKSLNTVIDDLFSFIVKMPMAHRIACFRDDVVFAILLYQRWIYPVDKSRREEDNDEIVDEKKNQ